MRVNFSKSKAVNQKDISDFSRAFGCSLPDQVVDFFLEFNGSKPETNTFSVGDDNESGVNKLICISEVLDERKFLDFIGIKVFPVAIAEGGNYVVIDLNQGQSVFFWDHEKPAEMTFLASDIQEFLNGLVPFDPDSIELKEGQVESVWIDPDFLKSLK
ncbi:SMI1/KNR4 family protein [Pseudomonas syringae group sp. J309-1]|uniref:SMI1/KNR4 family protein n=1 Tax=Pseudomonas syringae group sp. J309-1 TaxID=3079588 RepID=UPI00290D4A12|nr:SMI1/KNR4 family protein [Pseudomonas syringae group sp. J309-1]MDU8357801.1 SMI1/KNR4 family protein [Pseudomonas syringae group sp. J309-1]